MALVADPTISLGHWPSATGCVCWSADCEIAVALGDHVDVLIPKLILFERPDANRRLEWQRVSLSVSLFTAPEWPMFDPRPWRIFSIGEEQSNSHAISLAYSPPGLAKHKKCALAVLTANSVLSIWAAESDPKNERSWKRVLVVNQALQSTDEESDHAVLSMRIRSFCWGPGLDAVREVKVSRGRRAAISCQTCLLAAATDLGDIAIVEIRSPHQSIDRRVDSWSARLLVRHNVTGGPHIDRILGTITADALVPKIVKHLAWSHSTHSGGQQSSPFYGSVLAYLVGESLFVMPCKVTLSDKVHVDFAPRAEKLDGSHKGPLAIRREPRSEAVVLVSFAADGIHVYTLQNPESGRPSVRERSLPRDLAWEMISGLAFTSPDTLHYSTFFSYSDSQDISLACFSDPLVQGAQPHWARLLDQEKAKFGAANGIAHRVLGRIWGLAADPAGCCAAVYCSLHPSEMPQFAMRVEQDGFLLLSLETSDLNFDRYLSAESLLLAVNLRIESARDSGREYQDICDMLSRHVPPRSTFHANQDRANNAVQQLITLVRPLDRLAGLITPEPGEDVDPANVHEAENVFRTVSPIWHAIRCSDFDKAALSGFERLILRNLRLAIRLFDHQGRFSRSVGGDGEDNDNAVVEPCGICSRPIEFEHFLWATCEKGHYFKRCILTLLAIQSAGISRYCGICKRPTLDASYLNKEVAKSSQPDEREPDVEPTKQQQQQLGLVDLLLAAFDTCVSCGGKFSG